MKINKVSGVLSTFFLLLTVFVSNAQINKVPNLKMYDYNPLHFGFTISGNQMDFVLKPKENLHQIYFKGKQLPEFDLGYSDVDSALVYGIEAIPSAGFCVGIIGNFRLGNYFDLRFVPSLAFGSRTLSYDTRLFRQDDTVAIVLNQKINSTFIDFPLYLKYKSKRLHNMRAYVFGGIKFSFDLASQANKKEDDNYEPKLFRSDIYGIIGAGLDFYMNWFKFGIEVSMSYGMRDMLLREGNLYTDSIESLKSKIFMLTFTFE